MVAVRSVVWLPMRWNQLVTSSTRSGTMEFPTSKSYSHCHAPLTLEVMRSVVSVTRRFSSSHQPRILSFRPLTIRSTADAMSRMVFSMAATMLATVFLAFSQPLVTAARIAVQRFSASATMASHALSAVLRTPSHTSLAQLSRPSQAFSIAPRMADQVLVAAAARLSQALVTASTTALQTLAAVVSAHVHGLDGGTHRLPNRRRRLGHGVPGALDGIADGSPHSAGLGFSPAPNRRDGGANRSPGRGSGSR